MYPVSSLFTFSELSDFFFILGTTNVFDSIQHSREDNSTLKRHGDIILVPQPSDDPNDPLVSTLYPSICGLLDSDPFRTGRCGSGTSSS